MIKRSEYLRVRQIAADMIEKAGIAITQEEIEQMQVVDLGLGRLAIEGVQVVTFFNTQRVCAKVIALLPNQTEPEHWHPAVGDDPGKEETIRVIKGNVYFYTEGEDNQKYGFIPEGKEDCYTVRHETVLKPTDQITLMPGEKHWFQTDMDGAVMYCFSSCARDLKDQFTDPAIDRDTVIVDDEEVIK